MGPAVCLMFHLTTTRASSNVRHDASATSLISSLHSPFFQEAFISQSSLVNSPVCPTPTAAAPPPPHLPPALFLLCAPAGTVAGRWVGDDGLNCRRRAPGRLLRRDPGDGGGERERWPILAHIACLLRPRAPLRAGERCTGYDRNHLIGDIASFMTHDTYT